MDTTEIREKLIQIIRVNVDENATVNEMNLRDDLSILNFNSLSFIKVIVDIESEFDIEFEDSSLNYSNYPTLTSLCNYIEKNVIL